MDDNIQPIKFRSIKKWHFLLPLVISFTAMAVSITALLGALIPLNHHGSKPNNSITANSAGGTTTFPLGETDAQTMYDATTAEKMANLRTEFANLRERLEELIAPSGTAYTHWGRETCNGDAELVYAGFGASSPTTDPRLTGSGVDYLCMPKQPEWNKYDEANDSLAYSWIYGAEYMSDKPKIFPDGIHGQNVVCSMCLAPRTAQIMIPAKRTCPDSWTKEYEGYLMSSYLMNQKSSFVCVDEVPEGVAESEAISHGALLYHVAGYCGQRGSLHHCPPYEHARELTCVVCTK